MKIKYVKTIVNNNNGGSYDYTFTKDCLFYGFLLAMNGESCFQYLVSFNTDKSIDSNANYLNRRYLHGDRFTMPIIRYVNKGETIKIEVGTGDLSKTTSVILYSNYSI